MTTSLAMIIHSVHAIIKVTEVVYVKITMISKVLSLIAPDYCYSCGKIGAPLCQGCIYNIVSEPFGRCLLCQVATANDNLCTGCRSPLSRAWVVGERTDVLQHLVGDSKFSSNRRACKAQAELLDRILPRLPAETILVPLPTIWPHQRQRGFGHAELIARALADSRGLVYSPILLRASNSVQHGSSRAQRIKQAKQAYRCNEVIDSKQPILLVDDVCTTGSSLVAAAEVLRQAGADTVWAAVTTRQALGRH